jgi:hypothetical protein
VALLPLGCAAAFAAAGLLANPAPGVRWSVIVATVILVAVWAALSRRGSPLAWEVAVHKQHWIQALAHSSIFIYWSRHWPMVATWAPLILTQLCLAYAVDMLLTWWRRRPYSLGFGPFPVIGSINLFLWFKPDWFAYQLAMVAAGMLAKECLRWERNGRRVHIFNPSSFPLALASLGLLATGRTDITWGYDVATLLDVPYMYLLIFLVALPGQFFFGVTTMTLSAGATVYLFSLLHYQATGTYFFPDTFVPIAVFLGMHLLFTDPSTSPATDAGRVAFGVCYGASVLVLFFLLERAGVPSFYDKLLAVPLLNLMVRAIDQVARRMPFGAGATVARSGWPGRRRHLAWMSAWSSGCLAAVVTHVNIPWTDGSTELHSAAVGGRRLAVRGLIAAGADPNRADGSGKTPLALAVMNGDADTVRLLVAGGARPDAVTHTGLTMLMLAARVDTAATAALVDAGAAVNVHASESGETALMWSVKAGHVDTVRVLMRAGADPDATDDQGRTALALAVEQGDPALVAALREGRGVEPALGQDARGAR